MVGGSWRAGNFQQQQQPARAAAVFIAGRTKRRAVFSRGKQWQQQQHKSPLLPANSAALSSIFSSLQSKRTSAAVCAKLTSFLPARQEKHSSDSVSVCRDVIVIEPLVIGLNPVQDHDLERDLSDGRRHGQHPHGRAERGPHRFG